MGKISRPPSDDRDWDGLLRRVTALETGNRAGYTTIHGQMVLGAGSTFRVRDAHDQTNLTYIGPTFFPGFPDPTDTVQIRRADGTKALDVIGADPTQQYIALYDRGGHTIVADDTATGQGLARPWLPIPWMEFPNIDAGVTGSTFVGIARAVLFRQQPKIEIGVFYSCTDGNATGQYRVMGTVDAQDDTVFVATQSVPGLSVGFDIFVVDCPGDYGARVIIDLQARLTAGTGPFVSTFSHLWSRQT
jgi:hypothetical protein